MIKNLFIFISIIVLSSVLAYASNPEGPPNLPTAFELEEESQAEQESGKSFWQKFKEFIGFNSEKKPSTEKIGEMPLDKKLPNHEVSSEKLEEPNTKLNVETKEETIAVDESFPDISLPHGGTDEGPAIINIPKKVENEIDNENGLNIPEMPLDEPSNMNHKSTDISQDAHIDASEEFTIPQLPDTPEEAIKGGQKADTMHETKENTEKILPSTDEITIPQLPDAIDAGAKVEGSGAKTPEASPVIVEEVSNSHTPALEEKTVEKDISTNLPLEGNKAVNEEISLPLSPVAEQKEETQVVSPDTSKATENKPEIAVDSPKNTKNEVQDNNLPIPDYANAPPPPITDSVVSKYKKEFESSKDNLEVPKISETELSVKDNNKNSAVDEKLNNEQLEFINNESIVLTLPNDDIVLGALTEEAQLEQMDFKSYIDQFWSIYNSLKSDPKRIEIENYIDNYPGVAN